MSGAQGTQPPESFTATTYKLAEGGENKSRTDIRSREDQGSVQIDKIQDKVKDAAGEGGPVFGAGKDTHKDDLGVSGTG
ncbi:PREDICTED: uncharacterized protein LOC101302243 [Fragaria vesca subsp. vesca]|uniref:uncharacterized protein LOC101302243 n=1 Tax=Fragaria vesca subsp. vesca TaxID=101020 RepID=UPI0002C37375|nr:PREDICTED: uncharacterized protein LOC101302243 [Fragaria vesca subsp. vesca]